MLIKEKNWSFKNKARLIEYKYTRYEYHTEIESQELVYCSGDTIFYMLLDLWNKENRHNKFYSISKIKSYTIEKRETGEWKETFGSISRNEIKNYILEKSIECRYIRVKTIDIDEKIEYIYNISVLLGVF